MFLFKQQKNNLYKDFYHLREVEELLGHTEKKYKEMLKKQNKGEIDFFEGLHVISEEIALTFDINIIELAELRLEYKFKDNLLFKFLCGALAVFTIPLVSEAISRFLDILGYLALGVYQAKYQPIAHVGSFLVFTLACFYISRNNLITVGSRILTRAKELMA